MYDTLPIPSDDPLLDSSPLVRALDFLAVKFTDHPSGILMTKGLSFRRDLVAKAIFVIQWPDWTEQEIYNGFMPIKVADEYHFEPFWELHYLLLRMKLARHYKGKLVLTKTGHGVFGDRFKQFDAVVRALLFDDPQYAEMRWGRNVVGNWDIWLNVLDVETQQGASGKQITEALYGVAEVENEFDPRTSDLYNGVLKPLLWCGLLQENMDISRKLTQRVYTKTPLWGRYLQLDPKKPMLRVVH
jgi:hypothetical protein